MTTDAAAADWRATAAALHEVADRLVAQEPDAERLRGRTGAMTGEALRRTVRSLRADAADAGAGAAALADVATALAAVRLDPTPEARHRLAVRLVEAARVMERIHGTTPPLSGHARGHATADVGAVASTPVRAGGQVTAEAAVAGGLVAGLITASALRTRIPVNGAAERPRPGSVGPMVPAGRGRARRDRGSRSRHALPAGSVEEWADGERAGPAVLGGAD